MIFPNNVSPLLRLAVSQSTDLANYLFDCTQALPIDNYQRGTGLDKGDCSCIFHLGIPIEICCQRGERNRINCQSSEVECICRPWITIGFRVNCSCQDNRFRDNLQGENLTKLSFERKNILKRLSLRTFWGVLRRKTARLFYHSPSSENSLK